MPDTGSHKETANDQGIFLRDVYTQVIMWNRRKKERRWSPYNDVLAWLCGSMHGTVRPEGL